MNFVIVLAFHNILFQQYVYHQNPPVQNTGFVHIFQGQIQALLKVIFKISQHLIAMVKYVSRGIYLLVIFFFTCYHNYVHCIML